MTVLSSMIGETPVKITGCSDGSDSMIVECASGRKFQFTHHRDCCESVRIIDVIGQIDDLLNSPILMAEEVSGDVALRDTSVPPSDLGSDSFTWTFYKFATNNGFVTIRWLGESNGYYSESVDFSELSEFDFSQITEDEGDN